MADEHIPIANTAPPSEPVEIHNAPPTSLEPAPVEKKGPKKTHVFLATALIVAGGYGAYLHNSSGVPTKKKVEGSSFSQQVEAPPAVVVPPNSIVPSPPVVINPETPAAPVVPVEPVPAPTPLPAPEPLPEPTPAPVDPVPSPPPVVVPPAPVPAPAPVKRPRWCHDSIDRFFYDMDLAWHRMLFDMGYTIPADRLKNKCKK